MSRDYKKHVKRRQSKLVRSITKLILNLAILAGLGMLIRYGYILFTHRVGPLTGSIILIVGIAVWVILIRILRSRYKYTKPSFKLTTFSVIVILLIFTFAGVQPLASYKDNFIKSYQTAQAERAAEREKAEAEEAAAKELEEAREAIEKAEKERKNIEELEKNVVELVNFIRNERGSTPVVWDNKLYAYSQKHSEDMASQQEMFHTPMDRPYGENVWWGGGGSAYWSATDIVESWMTSPEHRTWLLCPHLKHIAVGIATSDGGMYASWTFWRSETQDADWWYCDGTDPPKWWY